MTKNSLKAGLSGALAVVLAAVSFASMVPPVTVPLQELRNGACSTPLNNGYGAYILGTTEPTTKHPTDPYRNAGGFGMSFNPVDEGDVSQKFFVAGVSDGFFDVASGGGVPGLQGLIGFEIVSNPANLSTIQVCRTVIARSGNLPTEINSFGFGSISDLGIVSLRADYGSALNDAYNGLVKITCDGAADDILSNVNNFTGPNSALLAFSNGANDKLQIPVVGADGDIDLISGIPSGLTYATSFAQEIVVEASCVTPTIKYLPYGKVAVSGFDGRGHAVYNSTAGLVAVVKKNYANAATQVEVYSVTGACGALALCATINLPNSDDGFPLAATNYFSRVPFVGPTNLSMNDNGDIALTCVQPRTAAGVAVHPSTLVNDDNVRNSWDKYIVVLKRTGSPCTYTPCIVAKAGTQTAGGNGTTIFTMTGAGFATKNPTGSVNSVAVSSPSIDNAGRVYFTAATELYYEIASPRNISTVKTAVFVAQCGEPLRTVIKEGENLYKDSNCRPVTFIPLAVATSDLANANIRYPNSNTLGGYAAMKDSTKGVTVACRLGVAGNPSAVSEWNFVYFPRVP